MVCPVSLVPLDSWERSARLEVPGQPGLPVLLDRWDPLEIKEPRELWVLVVAQVPLGLREIRVLREHKGRQETQGSQVPSGHKVSPDSVDPPVLLVLKVEWVLWVRLDLRVLQAFQE